MKRSKAYVLNGVAMFVAWLVRPFTVEKVKTKKVNFEIDFSLS